MEHGNTTTLPVTAVIIPVRTAEKVRTHIDLTQLQRNTPRTAVPTTRSAVIAPPVAPMLVPLPMRTIPSLMVPGQSILTVSTVVPRPVQTADIPPTSMQAIL